MRSPSRPFNTAPTRPQLAHAVASEQIVTPLTPQPLVQTFLKPFSARYILPYPDGGKSQMSGDNQHGRSSCNRVTARVGIAIPFSASCRRTCCGRLPATATRLSETLPSTLLPSTPPCAPSAWPFSCLPRAL